MMVYIKTLILFIIFVYAFNLLFHILPVGCICNAVSEWES